MSKSLNGFTYKRSGENIRVSGFSLIDTYEDLVAKASKAIYSSLDPLTAKKRVKLIMGQGRVLDMPQRGEVEWVLGGYLREVGGVKRRSKLIFGFYLSDEDSDEDSDGVSESEILKVFILMRRKWSS